MKFNVFFNRTFLTGLLGAVLLAPAASAVADPVDVTVTVRNIAPANSVSFAALQLGFGNGSFDAFNINEVATDPIISVAELGSGNAWRTAFSDAESNAVVGRVLNPFPGPVLPGNSASNTFRVNSMSANNRFFTFAAMVVPSNDLFLGNDDPMEYELFDSAGNLLITSIVQNADEIWDAGSELPIVANAAFIPGSVTANREEQFGVVTFDRTELSIFNDLTTNAGYVFSDASLGNGTPIYEISFSVSAVPEPSSAAVLAFVGLAWLTVQRRKRPHSAF